MLKSILLSAVFVAGASSFALAAGEETESPMAHHHMLHHHHHKNRVLANGRCNGTSYGTGARSCGTATGGPVGGLGSRN